MKSSQSEFYRLEDRVLFEAGAVTQAAEAAAAENTNAEAVVAEAQEAEIATGDNGVLTDAELAEVALPPQTGDDAAADADGIYGFDGVAEPADDAQENKVLVVINSSVADAGEIVNDLGENYEILYLQRGTDALDAINDYLDAHSDTEYSALHIVSHGSDGYITLNGEKISNDTLNPADWKAIGEHLADDADIHIYGCDTAKTDEGKALIQNIADLTGADVAASTNATGANGDWDLEYRAGLVESATLSPADYDYTLETYTYTVTGTASGDAAAAERTFTDLKTAVAEANKLAAGSEINISFTKDVFTAEIDGYSVDADGNYVIDAKKAAANLSVGNASNSLDITINGVMDDADGDGVWDEGEKRVIFDGGGATRFFSMISPNTSFTMESVELRNGFSNTGAAIYIYGKNATVTFSNSFVHDNYSNHQGGVLYLHAGGGDTGTTLIVNDSVFANNKGLNRSGIFHLYSGGSVSITGSEFIGNTSNGEGGVLFGDTAKITLSVADSYFCGNTASKGGVFAFQVASEITSISNSYFSGNTGKNNGGAIYFNNAAEIGSITDSYFGTSVTLNGTTYTGNTSPNGGAIYFQGSAVIDEISNTVFNENTATTGSGGAFHFNGAAAITTLDATFTGNTAGLKATSWNAHAGLGGAIFFNNKATIDTLSGSFSGNQTAIDGGAFFFRNAAADVTIVDAEFINNAALGLSTQNNKGSGGAICLHANATGSSLVIQDSVFTGNRAYNSSVTTLADGTPDEITVKTSNHLTTGGGAIYLGAGSSTLDITDTEFSKNAASSGGAINIAGTSVTTITDSEFKNNLGIYGGALLHSQHGSTMTIRDTLFDSNKAAGTVTANNGSLKDTSTDPEINLYGSGGAIHLTGGYNQNPKQFVYIIGSTLVNNTAQTTGGGIAVAEGTHFYLANSTVAGNRILSEKAISTGDPNAAPPGGSNYASSYGRNYVVGGAGVSIGRAYGVDNNNIPGEKYYFLNNLFADNYQQITNDDGTVTTNYSDIYKNASGSLYVRYNVYNSSFFNSVAGQSDNYGQTVTGKGAVIPAVTEDIADKLFDSSSYVNGKWVVDADNLLQLKDLSADAELNAAVNKENFLAGLAVSGVQHELIYSTDNGATWLNMSKAAVTSAEIFFSDATGFLRYGYCTAGAAQYMPVIAFTEDGNAYSDMASLLDAMKDGGTFTIAPTEIELTLTDFALAGTLTLRGYETQGTVLDGEYSFTGADVVIDGMTFSGTLTNNKDIYVTGSLLTGDAALTGENLIFANTSVYNNTGIFSAAGKLNAVSSTFYNGGTLSADQITLLNSILYTTKTESANALQAPYSLLIADTTQAQEVFGETATVEGLVLLSMTAAAGSGHQAGAIAGYSGTNLYYTLTNNSASPAWKNADGTDFSGTPDVVITHDANGNIRLSDSAGNASMGAYSSMMEDRSTVVTTAADVVNAYDMQISLREAVMYANAGDTITFDVQDADYDGVITLTRIVEGYQSALVITAGMDITIDGGGNTVLTFDYTSGAVRILEAAGTLTVKNITLRGTGGAVTENTLPNFSSTTRVNVGGSIYGGGLAAIHTSGVFNADNTIFERSNITAGSSKSGAVYARDNAKVTITNSVFQYNYSTGGANSAVYHNQDCGDVLTVMDNVEVKYNRTNGTGQLFHLQNYSNFTLTNSRIHDNNIGSGAMLHFSYCSGSDAYLIGNTEIYNNTAGTVVHAYSNTAYFAMESSSIHHNSLYSTAITIQHHNALISNSIIAENTFTGSTNSYIIKQDRGNGSLWITNSTIAENTSKSKNFYGIYATSLAGKDIVMLNSVLAGNTLADGVEGIYLAVEQIGTNKISAYGSLIAGATPAAGTDTTVTSGFVVDDTTKLDADAALSMKDIFGVDSLYTENADGTYTMNAPTAGGWVAHIAKTPVAVSVSGTTLTLTYGDAAFTLTHNATVKVEPFVTPENDLTGAVRSEFYYTTIGAVAVQSGSLTLVNSNADTGTAVLGGTDGKITLRDAIAGSLMFGEAITFDTAAFASSQTITLSDSFVLDSAADGKTLTIDGSSISGLTLNLNGNRGFLITAADLALTLQGMTITGGLVNKDSGSVINSTGNGLTLTMNNMTVKENKALGNTAINGGALTFSGSDLAVTINNSKFMDNLAGDGTQGDMKRGGAIYLRSVRASLVINNTLFSGNQAASTNGPAFGGAVFVQGESEGTGVVNKLSVEITGSTRFFENAVKTSSVANYGGAVYMCGGGSTADYTLSIDGAQFDSNTAGSGGAVYAAETSTEISRSTFTGNKAESGSGGAVIAAPSSGGTFDLAIHDSVFKDNSAAVYGGAVYAHECTASNAPALLITDSTFYGNTAKSGGAIAFMSSRGYGANAQFLNLTIAGNHATDMGGGIFAFLNTNMQIDMANSLVLGNTSSYGADDITMTQKSAYSGHHINAYNSVIGVARHQGVGDIASLDKTAENPIAPVTDKGGSTIAAVYGTLDTAEANPAANKALLEEVFADTVPEWDNAAQAVKIFAVNGDGAVMQGVQTGLNGKEGVYYNGTDWISVKTGKAVTGITPTVLNPDYAVLSGTAQTGKYAVGASKVVRQVKTVDTTSLDPDAGNTLIEAIEEAKDGDTILISTYGNIDLSGADVTVAGKNLTIKQTGDSRIVIYELGIKSCTVTIKEDVHLSSPENHGTIYAEGGNLAVSGEGDKLGNVVFNGTEEIPGGMFDDLVIKADATLIGDIEVVNSITVDGVTLDSYDGYSIELKNAWTSVNITNSTLQNIRAADNQYLFVDASNTLSNTTGIYVYTDAAVNWEITHDSAVYNDGFQGVYDGKAYNVTATVGGKDLDVEIKYQGDGRLHDNILDAGTYGISISDGDVVSWKGSYYLLVDGTTAYRLTGTLQQNFTLDKCAVTVTAPSWTQEYGTTVTPAAPTPAVIEETGHKITGWEYTGIGTDADETPYTIGFNGDKTVITDSKGADVTKNYDISYVTGSQTVTAAVLSVKSLSVGNTDLLSKSYDGTVNLATDDLSALKLTVKDAAGKDVAVTCTSAYFNDADVADADTIILKGLTVDSGNYILDTDSLMLKSDAVKITAKELTVNVDSVEKEYNGKEQTIEAGDVTYSGLAAGQEIVLSSTGSGKNVGSYDVAFTYTVKDANGQDVSANYIVDAGSLKAVMTITPKALVVSDVITAAGLAKVYDGNSNVSDKFALSLKDGTAFAGDTLTLNTDYTAKYNSADVADASEITVAGLKLSNANYALVDADGNEVKTLTLDKADGAAITAKILSAADVSASGSALSKEYDGTTALDSTKTMNLWISNGVIGTGNALVVSFDMKNASFDAADAGERTITITGVTLGNTNYALDSSTVTTDDGAITQRKLYADKITVAAGTDTKVYDGQRSSNIGLAITDRVISGDTVTIAYSKAEYDTKDVGTNKEITVTGISLSNANYVLVKSAADAAITSSIVRSGGSITKRNVTLTSGDYTGMYDGKSHSNTAVKGDGYAAGEEFAYSNFASVKDVAADVANTFDYASGTANVNNYNVTVVTGKLTVTKRDITLTSGDYNGVYDGQTHVNHEVTAGGSGYAEGETFAYNFTASIKDAGSVANEFTVSDSTAKLSNYNITATTFGTLTVGKRDVTLTSGDYSGMYDGKSHSNTAVTGEGYVAGEEFAYSNFASVKDVVTDAANTFDYASGTANVDNYNVTVVTGKLTVTKRDITLTSGDYNGIYDGETHVNHEVTAGGSGYADGEIFAYDFPVSIKDVGSAANEFTVSDSTAKLSNYNITATTFGTLTVTPKTITVKADNITVTEGEKPNLTYKYDQNEIAASDLEAGLTFTGKLTSKGQSGNTPGRFAIEQGTLFLSDNYTIDFVKGWLTVEEKADESGSNSETQVGGLGQTSVNMSIVSGVLASGSGTNDTGCPLFSSTEYMRPGSMNYIFAMEHQQTLRRAAAAGISEMNEERGLQPLSGLLSQDDPMMVSPSLGKVRDGETAISDNLNGRDDILGQFLNNTEQEEEDLEQESIFSNGDYSFSQLDLDTLISKADVFKDELDLAIEEMTAIS